MNGVLIETSLQKLILNITDLYGDSELGEAHYSALLKRITVHLQDKKQPGYRESTKRKSQPSEVN